MKNIIPIFIFSLFLTGFLFIWHIIFPSMINGYVGVLEYGWNEAFEGKKFLNEVVQYHQELPAFAVRMMTTTGIVALSSFWNFSLASGFIVVNFIVLFLVFVVLSFLSQEYGKGWQYALLFFVCSFSVLFAFFSPIFTYDEPLQYLFFLLALLAYKKKWWLVATVGVFLSLVTRETTVLLFPGVMVLFFSFSRNFFRDKNNWYVFLSLLSALGSYVLFRYVAISDVLQAQLVIYESTHRLSHAAFNFQSRVSTIEVIVSAVAVLLPGVLLTIRSVQRGVTRSKRFALAFFVTVMINTPIVLLLTRAQEARLFALPMLFLWPVVGAWFYTLMPLIRRNTQQFLELFFSLKGVMMVASCILFGWVIYTYYLPTHAEAWHAGYRGYMVVMFVLCVVFWVLTGRDLRHTEWNEAKRKGVEGSLSIW